jgi:L-2-hydroxycarboxylate dehydrogenase (NAD+)
MLNQPSRRIPEQALRDFCIQCLQRVGVSQPDASITADVLVAADLRGVASHGVAHLRRYVDGLRDGVMNPCPQERVIVETPTTATFDAGAGLGQPISYRAMQMALAKARAVGAGFVAVRNSNHFGIAGYYAMMALPHDCIGMALTNAWPNTVPTFGRDAFLGTNPIAVAAPAGKGCPFVLDMATSTVSLGKIEIAEQLGRSIPPGWAIDRYGQPYEDPQRAFAELRQRVGGGLLPLGGEGDQFSGYKGYGLALWVEIFSALLSGAALAPRTYPKTEAGKALPANLGHFFGAWRIDSFRPADEFKAAMDELQGMLMATRKADGHDRIYIPGEKEAEAMERNRRDGIPLNAKVSAGLDTLARELGIEFDS